MTSSRGYFPCGRLPRTDRKGAIETGRDADLVAVGPLEGPGSLTEIRGVWRDGRRAR